jgi:hypothetical protein
MTTQRVIQEKQAVVDTTGKCTITFDPPPMGYVLTGTITLQGAPSGSIWQIFNAGQLIDIVADVSSITNIQAFTNETITATSSNLNPGSNINAVFVASLSTDNGTIPIVTPGHDTPGYNGGYARLAASGLGPGAFNFLVNLQATDRSLAIMLKSAGSNILSVVGQTTGFNWASLVPASSLLTDGTAAFSLIPVYGGIDSQVKISVGGAGGTYTIIALPDEITPGFSNRSPTIIAGGLDAGVVDAPSTVTCTIVGTQLTLVPAPAAGKINRIGTVTIDGQAPAALTQVALVGVTSGKTYMEIQVPTAGAFPPIPCDMQVNEAINALVVSGTVPQAINTYYRVMTSIT